MNYVRRNYEKQTLAVNVVCALISSSFNFTLMTLPALCGLQIYFIKGILSGAGLYILVSRTHLPCRCLVHKTHCFALLFMIKPLHIFKANCQEDQHGGKITQSCNLNAALSKFCCVTVFFFLICTCFYYQSDIVLLQPTFLISQIFYAIILKNIAFYTYSFRCSEKQCSDVDYCIPNSIFKNFEFPSLFMCHICHS